MAPSLFLQDFTVLDLAFVDEGRGVLGDSYYVSAELEGSLDEKDFLLDFSVAKKLLKALVDETMDHKLLVPTGSSTVKITATGLELSPKDGSSWRYICPSEALTLFPDCEINAGVIEYHLARLALAHLPKNVKSAKFTLRSPERFTREANFRYTHGLRFHEGNCQRLFHGHRNPIEVWIGESRSPEWEGRLALEWEGAHFVAAASLVNRSELDLPIGRRQPQLISTAEVAYRSSQGDFRGFLPASRVVLTDSEPSIETMSRLAANLLMSWGLKEPFRVVAFEGLNKGASFRQ